MSRSTTRKPRALALFVATCCAYATASPAPHGSGGTTQVFTDRAAFMAALDGARFENKFTDVSPGASGGLRYAQSGFEYLVFTQFQASSALYNGRNSVSTDRATDEVVLTLTSDTPVNAIGGNFWSTDFAQRPVAGTITVTLSDGTIEAIDSTGPSNFIGFIAPEPIFGVTVDAPDNADAPPGTSGDRWPTMTNVVVGNGS
ncbi:MAG TPA: hypothetical protein VKB52_07015 [Rhodanobacteraceae bacterium]|nr:hypothetical protein [Rhodanobacteraceae bacterium]